MTKPFNQKIKKYHFLLNMTGTSQKLYKVLGSLQHKLNNIKVSFYSPQGLQFCSPLGIFP